jgi:hypothetical protein
MKGSYGSRLSPAIPSQGKKLSWRVPAIIFGTTVMLINGTVTANAHENGEGRPIEGTWVVTVDPPGSVPETHISVASFTRGGVVTGLPDIFIPTLPGAGANAGTIMGNPGGSWTHIRHKEYASTIVAFTYNNLGQAVGMVKINSTYSLTNNDRFEGSSQLQLCDLKLVCAPLGPSLARINGRRLEVEPLQ